MNLNMKKYSFKENVSEAQLENHPELKDFMKLQDKDFEYRLVGITIHQGGGQGGHYWSLIHTKRGKDEPDYTTNFDQWMKGNEQNWHKFDD